MALPEITHLQCLVLASLGGGERFGRDIRGVLAEHGVHRAGPAFYQLMARLEETGLIAGEYGRGVVAGQPAKERRYGLTPAGRAALIATRGFYQRLPAADQPVLPARVRPPGDTRPSEPPRVRSRRAPAQPSPRLCALCGSQVAGRDSFCVVCGAKV